VEQFEWSESGEALREKIQEIITKHGGIEAYAFIIEEELSLTRYEREKRRIVAGFILMSKYKISHKDGAELLNLTGGDFENRLKEFKESQLKNGQTGER